MVDIVVAIIGGRFGTASDVNLLPLHLETSLNELVNGC